MKPMRGVVNISVADLEAAGETFLRTHTTNDSGNSYVDTTEQDGTQEILAYELAISCGMSKEEACQLVGWDKIS